METAKGRARRPIPDDFAQIAPLYTRKELRRRYRCGAETLRRWSDESGVDYKGRVRTLPVPDDFAQIAPECGKRELMARYGRGLSTINRWLAMTGAKAKRVRAVPAKRRDPAEEISLCLTCPFSVCRPTNCARIGRSRAATGFETAFDNSGAVAL